MISTDTNTPPLLFLMSIAILLQFSLNGGVNAFVTTPVSKGVTGLALFRRGGSATTTRTTSSSPLAEEALGSFPFLFRPENEVTDAKGRPKLSTTKSKALKTFNELARIYGDDRALNMVKTQPIVLCFDSTSFEPSFNGWAEQFDAESTKNMVTRNPGLLGVPPALASEPAEAAMALSYVVAAIRPLPKLVVAGALLALLANALG